VQVFTGPPESVRDHIMAAARALGRGDWEKAFNFITALKMWAVMPERERVMDMLKQKLKVEGLRTYLFAYSSQYKALSLSLLADLFQLSEKEVRHRVCAAPHAAAWLCARYMMQSCRARSCSALARLRVAAVASRHQWLQEL